MPNFYGNSLDEYTWGELAKSGSPTPKVIIGGSPQHGSHVLNSPTQVAFDSSGNLWVVNTGNDSLVEYTKAELARSGSPTPARVIAGAATGMDAAQYLAIEP